MKNLKKYLSVRYEKFKKASTAFNTVLIIFIIKTSTVYAESNTGAIDSFVTYINDWVMKIGGVVALIGGVMFCAGWIRDDADGKYRGLMVLAAGFMMIGIAQTPDLFGL
ncbi:MAG: hypothetical protein ACLRYM_06085 [Thomasclavelia ramosa]